MRPENLKPGWRGKGLPLVRKLKRPQIQDRTAVPQKSLPGGQEGRPVVAELLFSQQQKLWITSIAMLSKQASH